MSRHIINWMAEVAKVGCLQANSGGAHQKDVKTVTYVCTHIYVLIYMWIATVSPVLMAMRQKKSLKRVLLW